MGQHKRQCVIMASISQDFIDAREDRDQQAIGSLVPSSSLQAVLLFTWIHSPGANISVLCTITSVTASCVRSIFHREFPLTARSDRNTKPVRLCRTFFSPGWILSNVCSRSSFRHCPITRPMEVI